MPLKTLANTAQTAAEERRENEREKERKGKKERAVSLKLFITRCGERPCIFLELRRICLAVNVAVFNGRFKRKGSRVSLESCAFLDHPFLFFFYNLRGKEKKRERGENVNLLFKCCPKIPQKDNIENKLRRIKIINNGNNFAKKKIEFFFKDNLKLFIL